jgi:hypothetical protein
MRALLHVDLMKLESAVQTRASSNKLTGADENRTGLFGLVKKVGALD